MDDIGFDRGSDLLKRHLACDDEPTEFTLMGRTWLLLGGVFNPSYTPVTQLFSEHLPYPPGGSFLEMGCGAGVTAVIAALSGCRTVTALDISPAAVANTKLNAARHGVADTVRVAQSDLFSALAPDERFDMIFWNSNFAEPPDGFVNETDLHHAFFDPGYTAHRRFVREAPGRLTERGRLLLGFCSIGNADRLAQECAEAGLRIELVWSQSRVVEAGTSFEFQILELCPAHR
jgi:release factor glutamine methyltransferase